MPERFDGGRRACLGALALAGLAPWLQACAGKSEEPATPAARAYDEGRAHGAKVLDVRDFGARGDGIGDDTEAFQKAIDALPADGGTVAVPPGRYRIDALRSIRPRSRTHLRLADGAELHAIPNAAERAYVINILGVRDVEISGGAIVGERDAHRGSTGEWGHGIMVRGSQRVTVRDIRISRCWGDGISIGAIDARKGAPVVPSEDVLIARVVSTGNRRQGLTVGRSRRVRVYDGEFSHTGGTAPAAGIDVEPDAGHGASDVVIERCRVHDNRGPGIQVYHRVEDATIRDCVIADNGGHGILVVHARKLAIRDNRIERNRPYGIGLKGRAADVRIEGNRFVRASGAGRAAKADSAHARHIRSEASVRGVVVADGNRFD